MRTSELRELSAEKVREQLDDARENYFKLRFQFATGQLTDHTRLRFARKEIARIATVLRELELTESGES